MDDRETKKQKVPDQEIHARLEAEVIDEGRESLIEYLYKKRIIPDEFSVEIFQQIQLPARKQQFVDLSPNSCFHSPEAVIGTINFGAFYNRVVSMKVPFALSSVEDAHQLIITNRNRITRRRIYLGMIPMRCSDGEYRILTFKKDPYGWIWIKSVFLSEVEPDKRFFFRLLAKKVLAHKF